MKITTVVNFILDESGSMNSIADSVISGFNEYINDLKSKAETEILFTLTKFDSRGLRTPYVMTPIKEVSPLSHETYQPNAMTPLYDAVVETLQAVEKKAKENQAFVVIIMTDGLENHSTKHTQKCMKDEIHRLEHKGNWTFVYMGANQDSYKEAEKYGIQRGNIMDWQASEQGAATAFSTMSASTMSFSAENSKGILRSSSFYTPKEKKK